MFYKVLYCIRLFLRRPSIPIGYTPIGPLKAAQGRYGDLRVAAAAPIPPAAGDGHLPDPGYAPTATGAARARSRRPIPASPAGYPARPYSCARAYAYVYSSAAARPAVAAT